MCDAYFSLGLPLAFSSSTPVVEKHNMLGGWANRDIRLPICYSEAYIIINIYGIYSGFRLVKPTGRPSGINFETYFKL